MWRFLAILLLSIVFNADCAFAEGAEFSIRLGGGSESNIAASIKLMLLFTALAFLPAIILTMTSFTRISVVLGMVRTSLGTQSAPPNMIITGLALFLTTSIMSPVFNVSYQEGIKPYVDGMMEEKEALEKAINPFKKFLYANARAKDIELFLGVNNPNEEDIKYNTAEDLPLSTLVPAFVVGELNSAFQIGFLIALPFLVLDMVVSSVLTAMSMITLPPVVVSLPLKLMLFVVVDGWHLIISSLVKSY